MNNKQKSISTILKNKYTKLRVSSLLPFPTFGPKFLLFPTFWGFKIKLLILSCFFHCIGLCHLNVLLGEILGNLGFCGVFRWLGIWGNPSFRKEGQGFCLVGLACPWITRREIEPQPTVALRLHLVRFVLTALGTCSLCQGGGLG